MEERLEALEKAVEGARQDRVLRAVTDANERLDALREAKEKIQVWASGWLRDESPMVGRYSAGYRNAILRCLKILEEMGA